jgi:hypothetical protein
MSTDEFVVSQFLGGYFHQDWDVVASSEEGVVSEFLSSKPTESERALLVHSLRRVAEQGIDSEKLFRTYGCFCRPEDIGKTPRQWLVDLAQLIEKGC